MNRLNLFISVVALSALSVLSACASVTSGGGGSSSKPAPVDAQLQVNSTPGRLKAKLVLKNTSKTDLTLNSLSAKNFRVEMLDGKPMEFKGPSGAIDPVKIKPGETVETAFSLQDSYPFWDRRTKYKIWYDGPDLKTTPVHVWF